ncbi:hypothetical protein LshimejAT787_1104890 [Lyophyllum shimeji]|uniref:Uncharacterized protein n=1 Tax=Lyophyllum shimeji TaxID=47721 RepID=A0A9P3UP87_LYOSH|nr:hypothetical protein LshimejAT787_1104890 [Lyophyllum shimeji]
MGNHITVLLGTEMKLRYTHKKALARLRNLKGTAYGGHGSPITKGSSNAGGRNHDNILTARDSHGRTAFGDRPFKT